MPSEEANKRYERGLQLLEAGRNQEAISAFTAAITADPQYSAAFRNRAEAYRRQGLVSLADIDSKRADAIEKTAAPAIDHPQPVKSPEPEVPPVRQFEIETEALRAPEPEPMPDTPMYPPPPPPSEPDLSEEVEFEPEVRERVEWEPPEPAGKKTAEERSAMRSAARKEIVQGVLLAIGAGAAAGVTYAFGGGFSFIFLAGAAYGVFRIVSGLSRLAESNNDRTRG